LLKNNKIKIADIDIAKRVSDTNFQYASPEMIQYKFTLSIPMSGAKIIQDTLVTKKTDIWFIFIILLLF
jgi:hypothetical protein